jgi:hypothetical protein
MNNQNSRLFSFLFPFSQKFITLNDNIQAFFYSIMLWDFIIQNNIVQGFFHIHFSALDHVKSTTIQAFIHSHCGLGFCHLKQQHLRLFVIFIALQFDHHVK